MTDANEARDWAVEWLDGVADGSKAMSQRKLTSVERLGGGIEAVRRVAEEKGVHLVVLEDETGTELVAASKQPFRVIC